MPSLCDYAMTKTGSDLKDVDRIACDTDASREENSSVRVILRADNKALKVPSDKDVRESLRGLLEKVNLAFCYRS